MIFQGIITDNVGPLPSQQKGHTHNLLNVSCENVVNNVLRMKFFVSTIEKTMVSFLEMKLLDKTFLILCRKTLFNARNSFWDLYFIFNI